jgi:hypothetical protein
MKFLLCNLFCFCFFFLVHDVVFAQDENIEVPDTLSGWDKSWEVSLNGTQASYSNWAQGGTSNIAAAARSVFTTMKSSDRFSYAFQIDTRYGGARLSEEGLRKTSDRLGIVNRFLYDIEDEDTEFKLFTNITFRTQFDKGFDYGGGEDGEDRLISRFMAPAYFAQNAGLAYVPSDHFSMEAGLGLQQKYLRDSSLAPVYNLEPGQNLRSEAGFTFATQFEKSIARNVVFMASVSTFTNMKTSVRSTDLFITHKIVGEINDYMNASFNLELVYDDDFSKEIQVAQVISLGLTYSL